MQKDTFLSQKTCDRCHQVLKLRTMSWFTNETICIDCSDKERKIRAKLPEGGRAFEGCGYIPIIDIDSILNKQSEDQKND